MKIGPHKAPALYGGEWRVESGVVGDQKQQPQALCPGLMTAPTMTAPTGREGANN